MRTIRLVWSLAVGMSLVGCGSSRTEPPKPPQPTAAQLAKSPQHLLGPSFVQHRAPAGVLPAAISVPIDGFDAAVLPNGRVLTPAGVEVNVEAPKPHGMAVAADGTRVATVNSGSSRFSVTLIDNVASATPTATRIDVNAAFMGIVLSPDGQRFYASGGENGNIWVGDVASQKVIGSVNLNGTAHPLDRPLAVTPDPKQAFKGTFPGRMVLTKNGRYLYIVDQGTFQVFVVDTSSIAVGVDPDGAITEPDNFAAVVGAVPVGRYPFGIALAPDERTLYVANVGVFEYTHLRPETPTGDKNQDFPLCFPGVGYPDDTLEDKTIRIKKIDATKISGLPTSLRDPEGVRCGYVSADRDYTIPGLGDPNVEESSSLYALDLTLPDQPTRVGIVKTGLLVGQEEDGIPSYSGSHPNSVAVGRRALYVANGNNDSISVIDRESFEIASEVKLDVLFGADRRVKGIQPVSVALSPDEHFLFVAEAGLNAIGVVALAGHLRHGGKLIGHIPAGWWPSSVSVSADGKTLFVANSKGRGAGPNLGGDPPGQHPKHSVMGTVQIISVPNAAELARYTHRVFVNNGLIPQAPPAADGNPIPAREGVASTKIKHVIFINKENLTHDQIFGDIEQTRSGVPVEGDETLALNADATPNHHELALSFAFSDNFYLEPTVSSDGHRWLTDQYTTEFEETHWPASYGGKRRDSGDDPEVIANYPGRIGFTDADGSPEPHDYNQHGGIYLHLTRYGHDFVNFGNGFEFAIVDEDRGTEPTGIRQHVNVPMEKVVRDNTDHLYPEYNTAIPDSPLPEDPDRFNRFGRFQQVFETHYVDRQSGVCNLPAYTDLYLPNDHGGGAQDINGPDGAAWDYKRYVQDNDMALGLTVELISNSPCWKDTVIFVSEDDTQNGLDHVDGYRTVFVAISPWVKHEYVSKTHASLSSLFKTIYLILGVPPLNLYGAVATDLRDMFSSEPDFAPYHAIEAVIAKRAKPAWGRLTAAIDFGARDAEEVNLRAAIMKSEGLPRRAKHAPAKRAARTL
jgi:DNA-binding beta-propeller fold protein YncE